MGADLADVQRLAEAAVDRSSSGDGLSDLQRELIGLGVAACATTLNVDAMREHTERALELGASPDQLSEVVVLVSAIGMHSLHEGARVVAGVLRERGDSSVTGELTEEQALLNRRYIGEDKYWDRLEAALPGFLDALLRLSPAAFAGFFEFCAIPWRSRAVDALTKELIYLSLDATPTHRYLAGLQLHIDNAISLGATREQVLEAIEIAKASGEHPGVG